MIPLARLLVIAKEPVPGRSKTRLMSAFSASEAAELAEAALVDTLGVAVRAASLARRVGLPVEPVMFLDGAPGPWLPPRMNVVPQVDGGLDVRLAAAFGAAATPTSAGAPPTPCLLIGMDTPQIAAEMLRDALVGLVDPNAASDGCIGLASDGGWWALGLRRPDPDLLRGLPMSTEHTGTATLTRLAGARLRIRRLPMVTDVDTPVDAAEVAQLIPDSAFGVAYRRLARPAP